MQRLEYLVIVISLEGGWGMLILGEKQNNRGRNS